MTSDRQNEREDAVSERSKAAERMVDRCHEIGISKKTGHKARSGCPINLERISRNLVAVAVNGGILVDVRMERQRPLSGCIGSNDKCDES